MNEMQALYNSGISIKDIANIYDTTQKAVRKSLKDIVKQGVNGQKTDFKPRRGVGAKSDPKVLKKVLKMRLAGTPVKLIGETLGLRASFVYKYLKQEGMPILKYQGRSFAVNDGNCKQIMKDLETMTYEKAAKKNGVSTPSVRNMFTRIPQYKVIERK